MLHEFLDHQCRSLVIDRSPFVRLRRCYRQALLTVSFKFVYTRRIEALKGVHALVMKNGVQFFKLIPSLPPTPPCLPLRTEALVRVAPLASAASIVVSAKFEKKNRSNYKLVLKISLFLRSSVL